MLTGSSANAFRHWALLPIAVLLLALALHMFWKAAHGSKHSWAFGAVELAGALWFGFLIWRGESRRRGEAG
jgi:hypothetical protein